MKKFAFIITFFLSLLASCDNEYVDLNSADVTKLEKKYNVKIENTKHLDLSSSDLVLIEENILKLKEKMKSISCNAVKLSPISNRLKTRSVESVEVSAWAFNLSWLHVSVGIDNDSSIQVDSWLTGVTIYSYEQKGLSHNFTPHQKQTEITFSFTAVCTITVTELVGVRITEEGDVTGDVNLETNTGNLYVDGY